MEVVGAHPREPFQFEDCPTPSTGYMAEQHQETEAPFELIRWVLKQVFIVRVEIRIYRWTISLSEHFDDCVPSLKII